MFLTVVEGPGLTAFHDKKEKDFIFSHFWPVLLSLAVSFFDRCIHAHLRARAHDAPGVAARAAFLQLAQHGAITAMQGSNMPGSGVQRYLLSAAEHNLRSCESFFVLSVLGENRSPAENFH